ncbi:MAG: sigma-70 family RNA polymerase sigma factor, partial [Candidatus Paceibacterota bacterium]
NDIVLSAEARAMIEAINVLPPNYRDVLYLRLIEDFTPEEIGNMFGMSANMVSVRITRGLEKLRKELKIEKIL